eukprot:gnl/TRDRNA2_/TRDRNA2_125959_c0_seq1.p1 gnl/TRDRNA2_/TRDRNA2_125959_c0~~gnl/TRDRNA2_/TRDRNA2_125959_c0_seq1.p1  ORF type:complete len:307 (+),score=74.64 gnl/TRDRNA2_/TRDRNA2_125959_c0_seq1:3-923(+)
MESIVEERQRAHELETCNEGRHKKKALKRWKRIVVWLEQILEGRRWKLQGGAAAGDSMYDLEWDDEDDPTSAEGQDGNESMRAKLAQLQEGAVDEKKDKRKSPEPNMFEPQEELLRQLIPEELEEWARAHAACARILEVTDKDLALKHASCGVLAATIGKISKEVEVSARSTYAARLVETDQVQKAVEVLKVAQSLDPTSSLLKDQAALALQQNHDQTCRDLKDVLQTSKKDLATAVESEDTPRLLKLLEELDGLPLTWEAASTSLIGKELGKCAKYSDPQVAEKGKALVSRLHKLAKAERPLWVR